MAKIVLLASCALMFAWSAVAEGVASKRGNVDDVEYAIGWIVGLDDLTDEIFLDDGKVFVVAPHVNFEMLAPGLRVKLMFQSTPSGRKVQQILPVAPSQSPAQPISGVLDTLRKRKRASPDTITVLRTTDGIS